MNSKMIKAILIFLFIDIGLSLLSWESYSDFSLENNIISIIIVIFWVLLSVWLVNFFRTHLVDNSNEIKEIGVWGYLWRAIVIRYSAMLVAVLLFTIFVMGAGASANPSEQLTIIMAPLFYVFSVFTAWLFFSKNRIGQAKWLMYALSFNKV